MAIISVCNVSKSYSEHLPVLQGISFDLAQGEITAIIGRSGAGKSTLVQILAGLLEPDEGAVYFSGTPLEGPSKKLVPGHKEIRLVHQDFRLMHRMTIEENIRHALIDYTAEYKQHRVGELLHLCKLEAIKDQYIHEISGGERQRVAIARAISTAPEALLMDEPFNNLDVVTKSGLLQEVRELARETSTAILLVTHDTRDALEAADNIIVIESGGILQKGPPEEIYHQPKTPSVAQLLGLFTHCSAQEISRLVPRLQEAPLRNRDYGVWAEDVRIGHPEEGTGIPGKIQKVIFSGSCHKLLIDTAVKPGLWAFDHTKTYPADAEVNIKINESNVFAFETLTVSG